MMRLEDDGKGPNLDNLDDGGDATLFIHVRLKG